MESIECAVVGAGVIGLGIAEALARAGHETLILEAEAAIGTGVSARNSEVIHAGIYYEPGSLKAQLCLRGRELLYRLCAERGIHHRRCGKLIVASDAGQMAALTAIADRARASGVFDLQFLSRIEALSLEPELDCVGALLSPSTGIIDAHDYMTALLGMAEQQGATLALHSPVDRLRAAANGIELHLAGAREPSLHAKWVINAAGLDAVPLARRTAGLCSARIPALHYAKGSYFTSTQRAPFTHLIYPVPEPGGLGVHLTLDQAGQARFGPDVEWIDAPDYRVDERRADRFYAAIRRYWPALREGALTPAYSGIRPKIVGPGAANADFRIDGPADHGVDGLVNLFGIESPGLTASLAIAEHVASMVRGKATSAGSSR